MVEQQTEQVFMQKQPSEVFFNPNKAGLFEGSFSWGGGGAGSI